LRAGSEFANANSLLAVRRNGIVAESPQDLHWQIRGLGAESPVFCLESAKQSPGKKCAHEFWNKLYILRENNYARIERLGI
jgi:hypothetical protein